MNGYLNFSRFVENKVKKKYVDQNGKFSSGIVYEKLKYAQDMRAKEWDAQADIGWRIRNNELPLVLDRPNWEKFKDKYFKDNWIVKSIKLKNSYFVGGNIFFDLKRFDGNDINDPVISALENEVNFAYIQESGILELIQVLYDTAYVGFGVDHTGFNPYRRTPYWLSGKIEIEHIDSRDIWYLSTDGLCQKIYAIFYKNRENTETLKEQHPTVADQITETPYNGNGSAIDVKGHTDVWTCLFMHTISFNKREVRDMIQKKSWLYLEEEIDQFKEKLVRQYAGEEAPDETFGLIVDQFREISQDAAVETFASYINNEEFMLEQTAISPESVRDDDDLWFKVRMTADQVILPQETGIKKGKSKEYTDIKYFGKESGFHFLPGEKRNHSMYPFGSAWFNSDMLEIKTLLMTTLAFLLMKHSKPTPVYEEGSLKNETNWMSGWWRNDIIPIVKKEWRTANATREPFKYVTAPFDKNTFMTMDNIATESIKNQEGAVDALRGVSKSGDSGVKNQQLESAATTYHKIDEIYIHNYLKNQGQTILNLIAKYRRFPHQMTDYNEDGSTIQIDVNVSPDTMYNIDHYYVVPSVEPTPEMQRQADRNMAENLINKNMIHPLDYLKMMGVKNPDRIFQRSQLFQQMMQIQQLMENNPELIEQMQNGEVQEGEKEKVQEDVQE